MWGREQVIDVEGLPLRVVRAGSGPPLLLINGIGAPAEMWAPIVARLDGHELVAFDLPGVGSSPPLHRPTRMRGLAELVMRLLDELGYDRIDVLGYSFGGSLRPGTRPARPERVGRLVLCATMSGVGLSAPATAGRAADADTGPLLRIDRWRAASFR